MNEGKRFENNFKASVPNDVFYIRLHDSSIGFDIEHSTQRFALQSPFDCVLYKQPHMYCLELKSTGGTAISFNGSSPMIKEHQVKNLLNAAKYCRAGFVFNFRRTGNTYYVPISEYVAYAEILDKKSINENDMSDMGQQIKSRKLKVNYRYQISDLFE